jgi:hypothetical protein
MVPWSPASVGGLFLKFNLHFHRLTVPIIDLRDVHRHAIVGLCDELLRLALRLIAILASLA